MLERESRVIRSNGKLEPVIPVSQQNDLKKDLQGNGGALLINY
jgi:hypothetical protein